MTKRQMKKKQKKFEDCLLVCHNLLIASLELGSENAVKIDSFNKDLKRVRKFIDTQIEWRIG